VDRQRILERERDGARLAATGAVLTLALFVVSLVIQQVAGLATGASEADQLRSLHDHSGAILTSSVFRAAAFLLLPLPMLYLFRAAQARNPRVQGVMIAFVFIGPILFAAQGIVQAKGAGAAGDDFVKSTPEQTRSYPAFQRQVHHNAKAVDKVTLYTATKALEVQQTDGTFYSVANYPASAESRLPSELDHASPSIDHATDSDADAQAGDALATHVTDNNGTIQVSQAMAVPALLGLVVMMVYIPLQALRAGLLTRAVGSLGIALGAAIVILPFAMIGVLIWVGYLGLLIAGRVPGGRPPAWEAGEAIPWPRAGEPAPAPAGDAIEGEASEVSGEEASDATEPSQQRPRQKRKRRR
jgi:hypothetical protein